MSKGGHTVLVYAVYSYRYICMYDIIMTYRRNANMFKLTIPNFIKL